MRHNNEAVGIPRHLLMLLPALFACLLLGLFFGPFSISLDGEVNDEGPSGIARGGAPDELLLRGRQAQRSAATSYDKSSSNTSRDTRRLPRNSNLATYFAEAHAKVRKATFHDMQ